MTCTLSNNVVTAPSVNCFKRRLPADNISESSTFSELFRFLDVGCRAHVRGLVPLCPLRCSSFSIQLWFQLLLTMYQEINIHTYIILDSGHFWF